MEYSMQAVYNCRFKLVQPIRWFYLNVSSNVGLLVCYLSLSLLSCSQEKASDGNVTHLTYDGWSLFVAQSYKKLSQMLIISILSQTQSKPFTDRSTHSQEKPPWDIPTDGVLMHVATDSNITNDPSGPPTILPSGKLKQTTAWLGFVQRHLPYPYTGWLNQFSFSRLRRGEEFKIDSGVKIVNKHGWYKSYIGN